MASLERGEPESGLLCQWELLTRMSYRLSETRAEIWQGQGQTKAERQTMAEADKGRVKTSGKDKTREQRRQGQGQTKTETMAGRETGTLKGESCEGNQTTLHAPSNQ